METKCDIYEAEQLTMEMQDIYKPALATLTEEEWIDLLVIALS